MKRLVVVLTSLLLLTSAVYAQEEKKSIGLTVGTDYYSTYLFRGAEWMGGEGAFAPYISYDIMGTGLVISVAGELSQNQASTTATNAQSIDFGLDYSYTFAKLVTVSAGAWYWYYIDEDDWSFLTLSASVGFEVFLKPTISYTHDLYFNGEAYEDFYLTLSIGHDFDLGKGATLGLGLSAGMYHAPSVDSELSSDNVINDITATVSLGFNVAGVDIAASINGIVRPHYKDNGLFKSYATVGASYTF